MQFVVTETGALPLIGWLVSALKGAGSLATSSVAAGAVMTLLDDDDEATMTSELITETQRQALTKRTEALRRGAAELPEADRASFLARVDVAEAWVKSWIWFSYPQVAAPIIVLEQEFLARVGATPKSPAERTLRAEMGLAVPPRGGAGVSISWQTLGLAGGAAIGGALLFAFIRRATQ